MLDRASASRNARLHDLRHLQASLLLDAGEAITTVSARLGHRDTSTTLRIYSHLMPGADQRAAEIVGKAFSRPPADSRRSRSGGGAIGERTVVFLVERGRLEAIQAPLGATKASAPGP